MRMRLWRGREIDNRKEESDDDSGTDDLEPDWDSDTDEDILKMESEVHANLHAKNKRKREKSKKKGRRWNRKNEEVAIEVDEDHIQEINYMGIYDEEEQEVNVEIPEEINVDANQKIEKKRRKKGEEKTTLIWEIWEQEDERFIDENINQDTDLDNHNDIVIATAEPSSDLIIPLLMYQKEWLAWALKQEESAAKGGILADKMGMGKTVQAIALVLEKRKIDHEMDISKSFVPSPSTSLSPSSSTDLPKLKCTLVVCPVGAVSQWKSEIELFTTKGSTKVLIYHEANRGKSLQQFSESDFVITTYSVVESEYRNHLMPPKIKCNQCRRSFHKKQMNYHLRGKCGDNGNQTEIQSRQAEKLQSLEQTTESTKGKAVNEKQDRKETEAEQTLFPKKLILHSFRWNRIILDEVSQH